MIYIYIHIQHTKEYGNIPIPNATECKKVIIHVINTGDDNDQMKERACDEDEDEDEGDDMIQKTTNYYKTQLGTRKTTTKNKKKKHKLIRNIFLYQQYILLFVNLTIIQAMKHIVFMFVFFFLCSSVLIFFPEK